MVVLQLTLVPETTMCISPLDYKMIYLIITTLQTMINMVQSAPVILQVNGMMGIVRIPSVRCLMAMRAHAAMNVLRHVSDNACPELNRAIQCIPCVLTTDVVCILIIAASASTMMACPSNLHLQITNPHLRVRNPQPSRLKFPTGMKSRGNWFPLFRVLMLTTGTQSWIFIRWRASVLLLTMSKMRLCMFTNPMYLDRRVPKPMN